MTVRSLSPRLRIVSIIPGIDTGAPERTETSSGFIGSPNFFPATRSRRRKALSTSGRKPAGTAPSRRYSVHAPHAIVNPGGTGTPRLVISARLAPLPPSTAFMSRVPSALPAPKKYTDRDSAAAAEAELVWVCWRRCRVVTGEACVAKAVRAIRHGVQHAIEGEVPQRVDAEVRRDLALRHVRGDELFARRRIDAVITGAGDRRRAHT